jgi:hypothetical protein
MRIIAMLLMLTAGAAQAAIYKCEVNGKTVMTDRPCAAHAQPERVLAPNSMEGPSAAGKKLAQEYDRDVAAGRKARDQANKEWLKEHAAEDDKRERVRNGIVERKAVRGMSEGELRQALGNPARVGRTDTSKGITERWEYEFEDGRTQTVTVSNGEVAAVLTKPKKKKKKK